MEEKIHLSLKDWLYNVGVVGFINILKYAGHEEEIEFNGQEVIIDSKVLENFEEKYFNYFINTYEKKLAWSKVVSYRNKIEYFEKENYSNFDKKAFENFNKYIENLKKYLKSNSHKAAYELISSDFPILEKEKNIQKIKLKKNESIEDRLEDVKRIIEKIKEVIDFYSLDEVKKYIAAKNVIYTIIKNAWNGISFLNPQTKEKNIYSDYKNYFPLSTFKYLNESKEKYKYDCFTCDNKIKKMDNDLGFLNATGFDTSRKTSHVWNFVNDIAICPVCKLIYSCVPAGFTYVYDKGIYVNANRSIAEAIKINNRVRMTILNDEEMNSNTTYRAMITAMSESINNSSKYELSDIQVVRYENEKYRFNILSKKILNLINNSKHELDILIKAGYKEIDKYFRVYEEVMRNILNNENMFLLIHKMLILKLTKSNNALFNGRHLLAVININFEYLKGVGEMKKIEKDALKSYNGAGYYLKQAYKDKNSENKLNGISYRLLNALKTNNNGMFMDTILNCYLYTGKKVPKFFIDCLQDIETFKTIGYAFVSGLIDDKNNNLDGGDR
ncbi:type I-B CRISPR-associated protein Cas8b1/Cst1 [Haliovirga abyssi]|uniref:Type I-B CRISPR-associated protein Cas8b1/Cst1 n=1 Tax=Haliovirga abyssi TaxID=2996794 RepID=A0AAU9DX17_9FUSO|nr:type I-B CRISPR-associated protein Cas8b1/Cst1 [Haliovirga abyssi]BDU50911.1 type I-B CRISPR-associated protein Cas8b1/Cst1 [Haliovirga abyssi]